MPEVERDPSQVEPAARGVARVGLARLALLAGTTERVVIAGVQFLRVPLLLWGLSRYEYGLWIAILGVVATANQLDFGLHFGVVNAVSAARGRDDASAISRTVATAFLTYLAIATVATLAILPALALLPLGSIFPVGSEDLALVRDVALFGCGSIILVLPLRVHAASLTGSQEQWIVSLFRSVQAVVQLVALAAALKLFHAGLRGVAWVGFTTELVSWGLLGLWVEWRRGDLRVRLRHASRAMAPALLATGVTFLVINFSNFLKMTLAGTILSAARGPAEAPTIYVPLTMFTVALALGQLVGASLWPAYGEAAARGDWSWIARAFAFGTKVSLGVAATFAVLGAFFAADVIRLWAPKAGIPGLTLTAALGVWLISQTAITAAASLLNGMGRLRAVTVAGAAEGVAVFGASILVAGRWGAPGIAVVMAAAGVVTAAYLLFIATPRTTDGHVPAPVRDVARVLGCAAAAAAIALALSWMLGGSPPAMRLAAGAAPTAAALVASLWLLTLTPGERLRIRKRRAA